MRTIVKALRMSIVAILCEEKMTGSFTILPVPELLILLFMKLRVKGYFFLK